MFRPAGAREPGGAHKEEVALYIGIGTVLLIILIVLIVLYVL